MALPKKNIKKIAIIVCQIFHYVENKIIFRPGLVELISKHFRDRKIAFTTVKLIAIIK